MQAVKPMEWLLPYVHPPEVGGSPNLANLVRIGELVGNVAETTESSIFGYLPFHAVR